MASSYPDLSQGRDSRFFQPSLSSVPEPMAELLEQYSHIPRDRQLEHIITVRNQAYTNKPYPCLGRFRFCNLDLSTHPIYRSHVLPMMTADARSGGEAPLFLDIGTCLGQDTRKLIFDGVSPERVWASDIDRGYIEAGYALFRDRDRFQDHRMLCPGDVLASPHDADHDQLKRLDDQVSVIHITAVMHLFDLEKQKKTAGRCLRLLRKSPGERSLIVGAQVGHIDAGEQVRESGRKAFRHNVESWQILWRELCDEPEWAGKVKHVEVESQLVAPRHASSGGNHARNSSQAEQNDNGSGLVGENSQWQGKMIGREEDGFRWHRFWIWIDWN